MHSSQSGPDQRATTAVSLNCGLDQPHHAATALLDFDISAFSRPDHLSPSLTFVRWLQWEPDSKSAFYDRMGSRSGSCDEIIVGRKKDVKFLFGFTTDGDLILLKVIIVTTSQCPWYNTNNEYGNHHGHDGQTHY